MLVGAVAGSAIGLLIPFVHRRSLPAGAGLVLRLAARPADQCRANAQQ